MAHQIAEKTMNRLTLDVATSTGWAMLCEGDLTKDPGHWQLFARQKLRKWRSTWIPFNDGAQTLGYGFWDLSASEYSGMGYSCAKLLDCLIELNKFCAVDELFWEQRFPSTNFKTGDALAMLGGAVGVFVQKRRPRRVEPIENSHWSPHFIGRMEYLSAKSKARALKKAGNDRASARAELKSLSMIRARSYGFAIQRDDESDAIGMMDYVVSQLSNMQPPWCAGETLRPVLTVDQLGSAVA